MTPAKNQDEDGLDGAPWWVRAFVRVGAPTAGASVLIWFLMTQVTGKLVDLGASQQQLAQNNVLIVQNQTKIIELLGARAQEHQALRQVLTALCFNAARTDAQFNRCTMSVSGDPLEP